MPAKPPSNVAGNQKPESPGQISHPDVSQAKQNWNVENLWAHYVRKVVVPERKTGQNTQVFGEIPNRQA
jgi:hypothetical protein